MNRILFWFVFGVFFSLSILMIVFGIGFIRDVWTHKTEAFFGSLLIGLILIMVGGGLLSSTISETIRRLLQKKP